MSFSHFSSKPNSHIFTELNRPTCIYTASENDLAIEVNVLPLSPSVFLYLSLSVSLSHSDLSEQIKAVTKDSHVRAENTELMLSYQRGQISLPQYKVELQLPKFHVCVKCALMSTLRILLQSCY